jgi:hypothetical protein
MATQTTKPKPKTDPVAEPAERIAETHEAAVERVTELQDKAVADGKQAGVAYLSSYEKVVLSLADSYEKAAGATKVAWVADIAAAQADLTRGLTKAYTSAAREFVST